MFGSPLSVENMPDPALGTGEMIVDGVAAPVLPYAVEVFTGRRQYLLTLPVTPGTGAAGRVRAVGPDATRLAPGDWVLCDPTVRSRDDALTPDITLQGLNARLRRDPARTPWCRPWGRVPGMPGRSAPTAHARSSPRCAPPEPAA